MLSIEKKDDSKSTLATEVMIVALAFYIFPIVLYVYIASILTRMIKKIDPESHKTFKRKIIRSCIIVEFLMIARVIIFSLRFFGFKNYMILKGYDYYVLGHDVFYLTEVLIIFYFIVIKVKVIR